VSPLKISCSSSSSLPNDMSSSLSNSSGATGFLGGGGVFFTVLRVEVKDLLVGDGRDSRKFLLLLVVSLVLEVALDLEVALVLEVAVRTDLMLRLDLRLRLDLDFALALDLMLPLDLTLLLDFTLYSDLLIVISVLRLGDFGDFWFIKLLREAVVSDGPDDLARLNNFFLDSTPVDLVESSESLEPNVREDFDVVTDFAEVGLTTLLLFLLSHLISLSPS